MAKGYFPSDLCVTMSSDSPTVINSKTLGTRDAKVTGDALRKIMREMNTGVEVLPDWNKEFTGVFYSVNSIPQIKKVVYDIPNDTTIVYFADNSKEIARVMNGDVFDKEVGTLQCIAKKMYGSRSRFLKDVVNKGVVIEKKEKKKKNNTYIDKFLNGEICIRCNTHNDKIRLMNLLNDTDARWGHQIMPTEFNNSCFINAKSVYIGVCRNYEYKLLEWDEDVEPFLEEDYEVVDYQDFVKSI